MGYHAAPRKPSWVKRWRERLARWVRWRTSKDISERWGGWRPGK